MSFWKGTIQIVRAMTIGGLAANAVFIMANMEHRTPTTTIRSIKNKSGNSCEVQTNIN
jgi:hypothetical protein